jgi:NitT/TauT family transport system permease protein/taurine transport system permease protein
MISVGLLWLLIDQFYLKPVERATVERWGLVIEAEQRA